MSKKILVVLDPGHTPGANKGSAYGYYEGDKMYTLSEFEKEALEAYGIDVIITRKRDKDLELYDRGQVAVKNAAGYDEVVFISNHSNAFNGEAYGVDVYRSLYLPESADLAKKLGDAIVGIMKPYTGITYNRGVKTRKGATGADYYGVIRGSVSGAKSVAQAAKGAVKYSYIVEHGFHDNAIECAFLNVDANLKKIAQAEAKAIADYFGVKAVAEKVEDLKAKKKLYRVRKSWEDSKSQLGAYEILNNAKETADKNSGFSVFDENGVKVYPEVDKTFKVRVDITTLRIRTGAGLKYKVVRFIPKGIYTITETKDADGYTWGRLKSGEGWIALEYVKRL